MADFVRKRFEPDSNTATTNTVIVCEFWSQIGLANIVDETIVDTFGQTNFICNVHHLHEMVQVLRLAYSLGEDILDVAFRYTISTNFYETVSYRFLHQPHALNYF